MQVNLESLEISKYSESVSQFNLQRPWCKFWLLSSLKSQTLWQLGEVCLCVSSSNLSVAGNTSDAPACTHSDLRMSTSVCGWSSIYEPWLWLRSCLHCHLSFSPLQSCRLHPLSPHWSLLFVCTCICLFLTFLMTSSPLSLLSSYPPLSSELLVSDLLLMSSALLPSLTLFSNFHISVFYWGHSIKKSATS